MTENINTLRTRSIDSLKESILKNIDFYESGDDSVLRRFFANKENPVRETGIVISDMPDETQILSEAESKPEKKDSDNSVAVYRALKVLQPRQATVENVWAYLTHYMYPSYVRQRWPVPTGKSDAQKTNHIIRHWFVHEGGRGLIRDNAISRLWWMGFVASKCDGIAIEEVLTIALYRQDVRKNLFERSFCSSPQIFSALIRCLRKSHVGNKKLLDRNNFRIFTNALNRVGGQRLLDSLSPQDLDSLLENLIREELNLEMSDW